jgi:hypothetical protein
MVGTRCGDQRRSASMSLGNMLLTYPSWSRAASLKTSQTVADSAPVCSIDRQGGSSCRTINWYERLHEAACASTPDPQAGPPLQTLKQGGELRRRETHHSVRNHRPAELAVFQALRQYQSWLAAFVQGLRQLGWTEGQNLRMDVRWNAADAGLARTYAEQLIGLMPDVILRTR